MTNYSNTSYHSLPLDVRRRRRNGLSLQTNYTWSKALSGSLGDGQFRFGGSIGTLQRRMFSGPSVFSFDAGIQKSTRLTERHSLELRMEAQNILNHPTFYVVQFGLYWRF
jgi:hypothetical protein